MGAIDGVNARGCVELGFEEEPEILAIEEAVRVLLQGVCDDSNREGVRKTPLRVAKALREGTRGDFLNLLVFDEMEIRVI